jgi:hypothetical protein
MLQQGVSWDYQWSQIVGRAWADSDFKQRLLANPTAILEEYELAMPTGTRIHVLEEPASVPSGTDEVQYLLLPAKPSDDELCEDELRSVEGAVGVQRCGWCRCRCPRCRCGCWGCHHPQPDEN